jgi:acyl carrier protein
MPITATAESVRDFILSRLTDPLAAKGLTPDDLPPTFDLLLEGVIDSLGLVDLVVALENRFGVEFDFNEMPAEDLTRLGPLSSYVQWKLRRA